MLALKITDIRDFTNKLFIGEVFDKFCLSEATVTTFNTFTIDGRLQKDFFDTDSRARPDTFSLEGHQTFLLVCDPR